MKFAEPIFHITGCAAAIAAGISALGAAPRRCVRNARFFASEFGGIHRSGRLLPSRNLRAGASVANLEYYSVSAEEAPEYSVFLKDSNYSTYLPEGTSGRYGSAHPYETLSVMAGYNESYEKQEVSTGIARRANYTAGQVAEDGLFTSDRLTLQTYEKFFSNGADVISSSFKNSGESSFMAGAILDSHAAKNARTVFVGAASNDGGEGPGHVASPYRNMNVIKVGALDASTDFKTVAAFSSYGPNDFYNPITGRNRKGRRERRGHIGARNRVYRKTGRKPRQRIGDELCRPDSLLRCRAHGLVFQGDVNAGRQQGREADKGRAAELGV